MSDNIVIYSSFFINDTLSTECESYSLTLSLHDALTISSSVSTNSSSARTPTSTPPPARFRNSGSQTNPPPPQSTTPPGPPPAQRACRSPTATSGRSEEHTSELQSLMRISYDVFCLTQKKNTHIQKSSVQHYTHHI